MGRPVTAGEEHAVLEMPHHLGMDGVLGRFGQTPGVRLPALQTIPHDTAARRVAEHLHRRDGIEQMAEEQVQIGVRTIGALDAVGWLRIEEALKTQVVTEEARVRQHPGEVVLDGAAPADVDQTEGAVSIDQSLLREIGQRGLSVRVDLVGDAPDEPWVGEEGSDARVEPGMHDGLGQRQVVSRADRLQRLGFQPERTGEREQRLAVVEAPEPAHLVEAHRAQRGREGRQPAHLQQPRARQDVIGQTSVRRHGREDALEELAFAGEEIDRPDVVDDRLLGDEERLTDEQRRALDAESEDQPRLGPEILQERGRRGQCRMLDVALERGAIGEATVQAFSPSDTSCTACPRGTSCSTCRTSWPWISRASFDPDLRRRRRTEAPRRSPSAWPGRRVRCRS